MVASDPPARSGPAGAIRFVVVLAMMAWALRSLVVAPFTIPSGSMLPTMAIGDYLFVAKWPYGYSRFSFPAQIPVFPGRVLGRLPGRGDVVIFKRPGGNEDWVKRVIGLPGDTVALRGGVVILNGRPILRRPAGIAALPISPNSPCRAVVRGGASATGGQCRYIAWRETLPDGRSWLTIDQTADAPRDSTAPVTVPAGHLFLMGDNRDDSMDSRYSVAEGGIGLVPVDRLIGRAALAFWSTDGSASLAKPWTWFAALRFHRIGTRYQP